MRVILEFEPSESVPPLMVGQLKASVTRSLDMYGFDAHVEIDRSNEMEAHRRFWEWNAKRRAEGADVWPVDGQLPNE